MSLNSVKLNSVPECDQVLSELNFRKKDYEYKKMGFELKAEKYLNRYNALKNRIDILKQDLNALKIAIGSIPEGNIKNQLIEQEIKTNYKLLVLEERFGRMDISKVIVYQSKAGQNEAMFKSCTNSISIILELKKHLNNGIITTENNLYSEKPTSIPPDYFEEIVTPAISNANFINNNQSQSHINLGSGLKSLFRQQINIKNSDLTFYQ